MNATSRDYTLKQIAKQLALPEASVRYYRDSLEVFIPSHGTARTRRYPQEALDLLSEAAQLVREEGLSLDQVAERWRNDKAIDATTAATAQQQDNNNGKSIVPVDLSHIAELVGATWAQLAQQEGNATRQTITQGFDRLTETIAQGNESRKLANHLEKRLEAAQEQVAQIAQERNQAQQEAQALREELSELQRDMDAEKRRPLTWRERMTGRKEGARG